MRGRPGVQAELLLSLALIMFTATALLLVFFLELHRFQTENLHHLLARGFVVESQREGFFDHGFREGIWWRLDGQGQVLMSSAERRHPDEAGLALAQVALEQRSAHVQSGVPWVPIRFASPGPDGKEVIVGQIDAPLSGFALAGLILVDLGVFGYFGFTLLRRRVVGPLSELAQAVREVGEGGSTSVRVDGTGEVAELASAFNEMQTALAVRTGSLEKAVGELREANQQLVHAREGLDRSERLAMVGSMAAGVAHEVGNPMGAMLSFLDVATRDERMGDQAQHCLTRASEQGERVRVILRQLLDFSRAPQIAYSAFSMKAVAEQVAELVAAQEEYEDIQIQIEISGTAESELQCWGDRGHASQILLNLVLNAVSALRGTSEPHIRIRLETGYARERARSGESRGIESRSPDRVDCFIEDSGAGIALQDAERIFDPFFTTKEPGEGTGLGLANARKLAEEMNGEVSLKAAHADLGGALFQFSLPRREAVRQ